MNCRRVKSADMTTSSLSVATVILQARGGLPAAPAPYQGWTERPTYYKVYPPSGLEHVRGGDPYFYLSPQQPQTLPFSPLPFRLTGSRQVRSAQKSPAPSWPSIEGSTSPPNANMRPVVGWATAPNTLRAKGIGGAYIGREETFVSAACMRGDFQ